MSWMVARGVIDPGLQPPHPHANQRFDGEVHLSDRAVYFVYEGPTFPSPRVVRLAKEHLREWKHMEMDDVVGIEFPMEIEGVVAIEFATDRQQLSAMLHRSADSDPDSLVECGRSIEGIDLLGDGILARTIVYDWERRRAPTGEEYARAAAEVVDRVSETEPSVFVEMAARLAAITTDDRTPPVEGSDEMNRLVDQVVEELGYVEARARILNS